MTEVSRPGLVWDDSGWHLVPCWGTEISIDAIKTLCQRTLQLDASDDCKVSFLAEGAFNRVYIVEINQQQRCVIRVSLPVDPQNKTAGEVATLRWLKQHSGIPVPEVIAFDDSRNNEIGYEWILMEMMPGASAWNRWRKLSMEAKETLVQEIAEYQAQLFRNSEFRTIGTLLGENVAAASTSCFTPGRIVDPMFFMGHHFDYDVPRGPFRSSHDWLESYIAIIAKEKTDEMNEAEDEEDKEDAERNIRVARMLADLLPKIFPMTQNPPERTVLWHNDLSLHNIMVDHEGAITAVIDWECVSAMPFWTATMMPKFLYGADREEKPDRDQYADETPESMAARHQTDTDDELDNEGKTELYWIHLMEYEMTLLRKVYSDHIARLWSGFDEAMAEGLLKTDFYKAVVYCADGWCLKRVERWVSAINKGEFPRLDETLMRNVN